MIKNKDTKKTVLARLKISHPPKITLRMAPMIDVIFLLLIFFLVAAKWRPQENFLPFQLAQAQAKSYQSVKPEPLIIHIYSTQSGCQVQIGSEQIIQIESENIEADLSALIEKLQNCLLTQKRLIDDPVEIICQPKVKWEHTAKIYNVFLGMGLTDITFRMTE